MTSLWQNHRELLHAAGISDEVIVERGYFSVGAKKDMEALGFAPSQRIVPTLVIPIHGVVKGEDPWHLHRPDMPQVKDGRPRKYEIPAGRKMSLDIHPRAQANLANPQVPLFITEGSKKVDSLVTAGAHAVAGVVGVWNWRGRGGDDGLTLLPDWEWVALKEGRQVYVAFDSDVMLKEPVHNAMGRMGAALKRMGATVAYCYLPSGDGGTKVGVDDYLAAGHDLADVVACAVPELRKPMASDTKPRPHNSSRSEPVDTGELLGEVKRFIGRFVVLPSAAAGDLLALWALHTHAIEAFWATPYLRVVSAAPDSGKTLLLELLASICRRGWHAINPSVAVLYRKVDRQQPTLLLDEMDNYPLDERRDALAVLNAGYKRGATVDRCKENGDLEEFSVYCAKAYAGLDDRALVSTLLSRSITMRMERKIPSEKVDMWIAPLVEPEAATLRERCEAWAEQHEEALSNHTPDLGDLTNRAAEVWWPLLSIGEVAGGDCQRRASAAAAAFATGGDATDDTPDQVTLLQDIQAAFGEEITISSADMLEHLNGIEESPWGARRKGDGIDARGLARMLRPFKVKPKAVRVGDKTPRGYHRDQFDDAFARHLPEAQQAQHRSLMRSGMLRMLRMLRTFSPPRAATRTTTLTCSSSSLRPSGSGSRIRSRSSRTPSSGSSTLPGGCSTSATRRWTDERAGGDLHAAGGSDAGGCGRRVGDGHYVVRAVRPAPCAHHPPREAPVGAHDRARALGEHECRMDGPAI